MKISEIHAPVNEESKTYFIAGDWHSHAIHRPSLFIMMEMAKQYLPKKRRRLIINGDFLDCPHLMARSPNYKKWIKRSDGMDAFFIPMSEQEIAWGNEVLDQLEKIFSKIIFIEGNHDWRYRDFMKKAPVDMAHNFDYLAKLKLQDRGIPVVYYNEWLDVGTKLSITHGMYHGTSALKRHYEASGGKSVIFSHVHKAECKSFSVRGDTHHSWSMPAMSTLNPAYIKGRENDWSNGFGVLNLHKDNSFNFNIMNVWNDRLMLPCGKIIKA